MSRFALACAAAALFLACSTSISHAQPNDAGDWGDAPEGGVAYPWLGVAGNFPTCYAYGTFDSYIYHTRGFPGHFDDTAWFGPDYDIEFNGNAGFCNVPPYDADECYAPLDGDAGLIMPTAWSIGPNNNLQTCSGLPPTSFGRACGVAKWGRDIDITITNNFQGFPYGAPAYLNVLVDFDHSGDWSAYPVGPSCTAQIPEHCVRNIQIPPNFIGRASQLPMPDIFLGPDSGMVWVRFTITRTQVPFPFIGKGFFEGGETEDYMLHIDAPADPQEYGDAPDGVPAYPPDPTPGAFHTCTNPVFHAPGAALSLGLGVDYELAGNSDDCAFVTYDDDECLGDSDAGLISQTAYTIDDATHQISVCSGAANPIGQPCDSLDWSQSMDMLLTNNTGQSAYLNLLIDWDHDGSWSNQSHPCPAGGTVSEHPIVNLVVPPVGTVQLSSLTLPKTRVGSPGYAWARFTLSDVPAPSGWTGGGNMGHGETEDYLFRIAEGNAGVESGFSGRHVVFDPTPNPARGRALLRYRLGSDAHVSFAVFDAAGRQIRTFGARTEARGDHQVMWDGCMASGQLASTGAYFLRLAIAGEVHQRRVLLVH